MGGFTASALHHIYFNVIEKDKCTVHVARMETTRKACRILVLISERSVRLEHRRRREDNIKIGLEQIEYRRWEVIQSV
jgi:hypothetical protein